MTDVSRPRSSAFLVIALAAGLGIGGAGCAAEPGESASSAVTAQVSFVCIDIDNGDVVGRPLATLAACEAVCPADHACLRCVGPINDCI